MKGIFKKMKGRLGKKGGSLIAVMTAMAILSIVALCAAGIAITNYRTTQTYVSQDNYYYSAEAGQAQFVAHINDAVYNFSSGVEVWTEDALVGENGLYNAVISAAGSFDLSGTLYNGEYTVKNELVKDKNGNMYEVNDDGDAIFTIVTTVTAADDSTQEYTSTITIKSPKETSTSTSEVEDVIIITDKSNILTSDYAVYAKGSSKNTDWYGLWGGFNTYQTQKVEYNDPVVSANPLLSKIYTGESKPANNANYTASGIFHKLGSNESIAKNPSDYEYLHKFATDSSFGKSDATTMVDNFVVNIKALLETPGLSNDMTVVTKTTITLNAANRDVAETYYAKLSGKSMTINFSELPGRVKFNGLRDGEFYRPICSENGKTFSIAYQLDDNDDGVFETQVSNGWQTYTYDDHYYKNKWFFIDLGGSGTLTINNSTMNGTSTGAGSCVDGWGNTNNVPYGNIVMEDCGFIVNGNIIVKNAHNLSNCKVFATGDITLEKVYYNEGLLSCETSAGSDIIKQSIYYCDGLFKSNLVSRYAMEWVLEKYGIYYNMSSATLTFDDWQKECLISTGNTFPSGGYTGYLATYRYPTVLKATIIAKGSKTISPINSKYTKYTPASGFGIWYVPESSVVKDTTITASNVSVFLNPNASVKGVVDSILIEGQIFAKNNIMVANYNGEVGNNSWGITEANRYAASSQIQYRTYSENVTEITQTIKDVITETEYSAITIENSGIYKK